MNKKEEFKLTREEAEALVRVLMREWVPHDDQRIIFDIVRRLDEELNET